MPIWDPDDVIKECVAKYSACFGVNYVISRWPDKEKHLRNVPEIDAIAQAVDYPDLAIEHTRLESFKGQLMDNKRVQEICERIASVVNPQVQQGVTCVIPVLAFGKGFDWSKAESALGEYIPKAAPSLPEGGSVHVVDDVPFPCTLIYEPELRIDFTFSRFAPPSSQIESELTASVEQALRHKKERLFSYRESGARTALVIDSEDMALISHVSVYKAFLRAETTVGSTHLSDVMYGNTSSEHRVWWFAFRGDDQLLQCVNEPNWKLGGAFDDEWRSNLS